jgi:adenosylcobinamide-phosphate synthase
VVVLTSALIGLGLQWLCLQVPHGWLALGVMMSSLVAQRGLYDHVAAVAAGLRQGLVQGRRAVAHIVGRDPDQLDASAVARAAIESTAENFADGVVAPVLWGVLLGLPGMLAYKAINTADSMIGHRTPRYRDFGRFAARLDDRANWLSARLAAVLFLAGGVGGTPGAWRAMQRDASRHRSVNAGWPEAAMAGCLGLRLAGPRRYGGEMIEDAWMGDGTPDATPADIRRALGLLVRACLLSGALLMLGLVSA